LSNNNIRNTEKVEELYSLSAIQYLYLNGNEFTSWTVSNSTQMLKELRIDNNQLCELIFEGSLNSIEIISARYSLY